MFYENLQYKNMSDLRGLKMEEIVSIKKDNLKLIRSASVFDTYIYNTENGIKNIIKVLVKKNMEGKQFFNNELSMLRIIEKKNVRNFCKLVISGKYYYVIEFIPHCQLEERQIYKILAKNLKLLDDLSKRLVDFNTIQNEDSELISTDKFNQIYCISLIRAVLKKRLKLRLYNTIDLLNCFIFLIKTVQYENWTFVHNDFRDGNFLISEDLSETFIIDYDRVTTAYGFLSRDALLLCLHSDNIKKWSWQYTFMERFLFNLKEVSIDHYNKVVEELQNTKSLRYFMMAIAILHINSSDNALKQIARSNLNLVHDKKEYENWHRKFKDRLFNLSRI